MAPEQPIRLCGVVLRHVQQMFLFCGTPVAPEHVLRSAEPENACVAFIAFKNHVQRITHGMMPQSTPPYRTVVDFGTALLPNPSCPSGELLAGSTGWWRQSVRSFSGFGAFSVEQTFSHMTFWWHCILPRVRDTCASRCVRVNHARRERRSNV